MDLRVLNQNDKALHGNWALTNLVNPFEGNETQQFRTKV